MPGQNLSMSFPEFFRRLVEAADGAKSAVAVAGNCGKTFPEKSAHATPEPFDA